MTHALTLGNALVYRCSTRWADVDEFGHVNNVSLLQYVQEAVRQLMYPADRGADWALFGEGFMIVHHEIDYLRQLHHRDSPVPLETWVERIGTNSFTAAVSARQDGQAVFTTRTVVVARNRTTGRSRPLTPAERAHLGEQGIEGCVVPDASATADLRAQVYAAAASRPRPPRPRRELGMVPRPVTRVASSGSGSLRAVPGPRRSPALD